MVIDQTNVLMDSIPYINCPFEITHFQFAKLSTRVVTPYNCSKKLRTKPELTLSQFNRPGTTLVIYNDQLELVEVMHLLE